MSVIRKVVGANIRHYRKKKNLTQAQLAELVNSADAYIGSIERGEANFTMETLERICTGLQVDVENLFKPISIQPLNKSETVTIISRKLNGLSDEEVETVNDVVEILIKSFESHKQ